MPSSRLPRLILVSTLLAILLGLAVIRDATAPLDQAIARFFAEGSPVLSDPRFREAMRDLTALGSFVVLGLAVFASCAFLAASGRWRLSGLVLASSLGATALSTGLKYALGRARPDLAEPIVKTFTPSFPSGHAFLSTVVLLTIGGLMALAARRRSERVVIFGTAIGLAFAIGLSRVILGVHWFSDVAAGWLLGIAWASTMLLLARRLAAREEGHEGF